MRTPEQVKQARRKLESRRRENAEHAAHVEELQRETDRLERQARLSDDEYRTLAANHDFRFNVGATAALLLIAGAIGIIFNYFF